MARLKLKTPQDRRAWTRHCLAWSNCRDCRLCEDRREVVLVRGYLPADVLLVGEGPGTTEDASGWPFTGPAGNQWNRIWQEAADEVRGPVVRYALTNLVACRPTDEDGNNRPPAKDEVKACRPRLVELIRMASPKVVVLMGRPAKSYFPQEELTDGVLVLTTGHPAATLYDEDATQALKYRRLVQTMVKAIRTVQKERV